MNPVHFIIVLWILLLRCGTQKSAWRLHVLLGRTRGHPLSIPRARPRPRGLRGASAGPCEACPRISRRDPRGHPLSISRARRGETPRGPARQARGHRAEAPRTPFKYLAHIAAATPAPRGPARHAREHRVEAPRTPFKYLRERPRPRISAGPSSAGPRASRRGPADTL